MDLFNTQLRDYSVSFQKNELIKNEKNLTYLQSFKNQKMSTVEKESYDVMEYFMNINVTREFSQEFCYHSYLINQMMGAQSEVISFITKFHRILNLNDAKAYIIRVKQNKEIRLFLFIKAVFFLFCKGTKNIKSI